MPLTADTVEDIRNGFPHPSIDPIVGEPTYFEIKRVHDLLKSNASSLTSTLGGGAHGLLGLILTPAIYQQITGHQFISPADPGAIPNIPAGTNANQTRTLTREHDLLLYTYLTATRCDQALKQQLIEAVNATYIETPPTIE